MTYLAEQSKPNHFIDFVKKYKIRNPWDPNFIFFHIKITIYRKNHIK